MVEGHKNFATGAPPPMQAMNQEMAMAGDFALLHEVERDLRQTETVGWQNAYTSFEAALRQYNCEEAQHFIRSCMAKIVNIMLEQHPSKLGRFEMECVANSLQNAVGICLMQLEELSHEDSDVRGVAFSSTSASRLVLTEETRTQCFPTLAMIFNRNRPLYKPKTAGLMGNYWNRSPGTPELRLQCIRSFAKQDGFSLLDTVIAKQLFATQASGDIRPTTLPLSPSRTSAPSPLNSNTFSIASLASASDQDNKAYLSSEIKVVGLEELQLYLQALYDAAVSVSVPQHSLQQPLPVNQFCVVVMTYLTSLSSETLRKESTDTVATIIAQVRRLTSALPAASLSQSQGESSLLYEADTNPTAHLFRLWLKLTLRYILSGSLPQRLFGYEQLAGLIARAKEAKSGPRQYKVIGAGMEECNGIYTIYPSSAESNIPSSSSFIATSGFVNGQDLSDEIREGFKSGSSSRPPRFCMKTSNGSVMELICTERRSTLSATNSSPFGAMTRKRVWFLASHPRPHRRFMTNANHEGAEISGPLVQEQEEIDIDEELDDEEEDIYGNTIGVSRQLHPLGKKWTIFYVCEGPEKEGNFLPPLSGWQLPSSNLGPSPASAPPPVLQVVSERSERGEEEDEKNLELILQSWVQSNDIIGDIFGDRIHREVILRSLPLLLFLAQSNLLQQKDIERMLKASLFTREDTLQEELQNLWCTMLPDMEAALIAHVVVWLMDRLQEAHTPSSYAAVIAFISRIAELSAQVILLKGQAVTESFLVLLWKIELHPLTVRSRLSKSLTQIFNDLLADKSGEGKRQAFLRECIAMLDSSLSNSSVQDKDERRTNGEKAVAKALALTQFVIETYGDTQAEVIYELVVKENLLKLLFTELRHFVQSQRNYCESSGMIVGRAAITSYITSLRHRLQLIRFLNGKSLSVSLSFEDVKEVWDLLAGSASGVEVGDEDMKQAEREIVFSFFHQCGLRTVALSPAYNATVYRRVFDLICQETNFERMGMAGYKCFHSYFVGLNKSSRMLSLTSYGSLASANSLALVGLDALWKISVEAPMEVAEVCSKELLAVYSSIRVSPIADSSLTSKAQNDFLSRVFEYLEVAAKCTERMSDEASSLSVSKELKERSLQKSCQERQKRIVRQSLSLLGGFIRAVYASANSGIARLGTSPSSRSPSSLTSQVQCAPPHGLCRRGIARALSIKVQSYTHSVDATRRESTSERGKPPSFLLHTHSKETLSSMKARIAVELGLTSPGQIRLYTSISHQSASPTYGQRSGPNHQVILQDDDRPLSDVLPHENSKDEVQELIVVILPSHSVRQKQTSVSYGVFVQQPLEGVATLLPPAEVISHSEAYFEVFFRVIDSVRELSLQEDIWQFLQTLPTNIHILQKILSWEKITAPPTSPHRRVDHSVTSMNWKMLIWSAYVSKTIYTMEVVDSVLQPASSTQTFDSLQEFGNSSNGNLRRQEFVRSFVTKGGFDEVLSYLMRRDLDFGYGHAVAVHITKFCLFGPDKTPEERPEVQLTSELPSGIEEFTLLSRLMDIILHCIERAKVQTGLTKNAPKAAVRPLSPLSRSFESQQEMQRLKSKSATMTDTIEQPVVDALLTIQGLLSRAKKENEGPVQVSCDLLDFTMIKKLIEGLVLSQDLSVFVREIAMETIQRLCLSSPNIESLVFAVARDILSTTISAEGEDVLISVLDFGRDTLTTQSVQQRQGNKSLTLPPHFTEFLSFLSAVLETGSHLGCSDLWSVISSILTILLMLPRSPSSSNSPGSSELWSSPSVSLFGSPASQSLASSGPMSLSGLSLQSATIASCFRVLQEATLCYSQAAQNDFDVLAVLTPLIHDFLFTMPSIGAGGSDAQSSLWPLCNEPETRSMGFQLLLTLAQNSSQSKIQVTNILLAFLNEHSAFLGRKWGYDHASPSVFVSPALGSSRAGTMISPHEHRVSPYVGLRNQGNTCYMNSFLQQLFMNPILRDGIINAKIPLDLSLMLSPSPFPLFSSLASFPWGFLGSSPSAPEDLISRKVALEWANGRAHLASVIGYEKETDRHILRYDQDKDRGATIRIRLLISDPLCATDPPPGYGRPGKETGKYVVLPANSGAANLSDREKSSLLVLREVQRVFVFLRDSKMTCINPKSLVDVCKCLDLEFSVYQQNDASEFCDKLLDRLETALKKLRELENKQTQQREEAQICLDEAFGGKWVSQKLPRGCEHRYDREESFIRVELLIKGKGSIEESLAAFVEGELMDGDNKVECEGCGGEKKETLRRTSISLPALPNLLILHLKRFDLDFNTFETVKLNSRCSFPHTLHMKPYTLEGMEEKAKGEKMSEHAALRRKEQGEGLQNDERITILTDEVLNVHNLTSSDERSSQTAHPKYDETRVSDCSDYELKGVLVHSGVAQGGHYYSFIQDREGEDDKRKWYRFDDDEVSLFDIAYLERECFGGLQPRQFSSTPSSVSSSTLSLAHVAPTAGGGMMEMEMYNNALMLFYEKKVPRYTPQHTLKRRTIDDGQHNTGKSGLDVQIQKPEASAKELFEREVAETNINYTRDLYLFDPALQTFLLQLLSNLQTNHNGEQSAENRQQEIEGHSISTSLVTHYLFNVLLHAKEKRNLAHYVSALRQTFLSSPDTSMAYLNSLLNAGNMLPRNTSGTWLRLFLLDCTDAIGRQTFVQVTSAAAQAVAVHLSSASVTDTSNDDTQAGTPCTKSLDRLLGAVECLLLEEHAVLLNKHDNGEEGTKHKEELLSFIIKLAQSHHRLRSMLCNHDFVAKLIYIFLRTSRSCHGTRASVPDFLSVAYSPRSRETEFNKKKERESNSCRVEREKVGWRRASMSDSGSDSDNSREGRGKEENSFHPYARSVIKEGKDSRTRKLVLLAIASLLSIESNAVSSTRGSLLSLNEEKSQRKYHKARQRSISSSSSSSSSSSTNPYKSSSSIPQGVFVSLLELAPSGIPVKPAKLSSSAILAFSQIFRERAKKGCLDRTALVEFQELCGQSEAERIADGILSKYGTHPPSNTSGQVWEAERGTKDLFLTLSGFLAYYRDNSVLNPTTSWNDLMAFGFTESLMREKTSEINQRTPLEKTAVTKGDNVATQRYISLSLLPSLSKQALVLPQFYSDVLQEILRGMQEGSNTTAAARGVSVADTSMEILMCSCNGDLNASKALLQELMKLIVPEDTDDEETVNRPTTFQSRNFSTSTVTSAISLFHRIFNELLQQLEEKDGQELIESCMIGPIGIISIAAEKAGVPTNRRSQELTTQEEVDDDSLDDESKDQKRLIYMLIQLLLLLYRIPALARWLEDRKSQWAWMHKWLQEAIVSSRMSCDGNFREELRLDVLNDMGRIHGLDLFREKLGYIVDGAGTCQVNGFYMKTFQTWDQVPTYIYVEKSSHTRYTLFRCEMPSGARRWYISITPANGRPGTIDDIDFYYVPVQRMQTYPPESGWLAWGKNPDALQPCPRIRPTYTMNRVGEQTLDDEPTHIVSYDVGRESEECCDEEDDDEEDLSGDERFVERDSITEQMGELSSTFFLEEDIEHQSELPIRENIVELHSAGELVPEANDDVDAPFDEENHGGKKQNLDN